jgi:hypothetical protein
VSIIDDRRGDPASAAVADDRHDGHPDGLAADLPSAPVAPATPPWYGTRKPPAPHQTSKLQLQLALIASSIVLFIRKTS